MSESTVTLEVILGDEVIGTLTQLSSKGCTFTYRQDWENISTPLSLSMPPRKASYPQKIVAPYLWGLIPDSHDRRRQLGRQFGVSANNPVALLSKIGLDCAGAVRFCSPDQTADVLKGHGALVPLSDKQMAERLRALTSGDANAQLSDDESWSLAGAQAKTAVRQENGKWYLATGAQPTTHILKPGISLLENQALNEYLCMKTASCLGLPVSSVNYFEFAGEPAICVERYDRMRTEAGTLLRVHQEDLCQALSVDPDDKYPADGGPNANAVLDLLSNVGRVEIRNKNREDFARALFFNYLMMAPDGHAKNYSLLLLAEAVRLAPLYDIASGVPYSKNYGELRYKRAAMRIGGEDHFGVLDRSHLENFAKRNGFDAAWAMNEFSQLAQAIPGALELVFDNAAHIVAVGTLRDVMLTPLSSHCKKSIRAL